MKFADVKTTKNQPVEHTLFSIYAPQKTVAKFRFASNNDLLMHSIITCFGEHAEIWELFILFKKLAYAFSNAAIINKTNDPVFWFTVGKGNMRNC